MTSKLLINEPPLQVLPSLAKAIGLNESIIIQQLHYWLGMKSSGVTRDGHKWIYNSYQEWQEQFPFWSVSTIQRIFSSLEKSGLIISEQLEKHRHDMTKYYRIDYDKLRMMEDVNLESSDVPNCNDVNKESENTTENTRPLPLDWKIATGQEITQEDLDSEREQIDPLLEFEKAFHFGRLPWNSTDTWTKFAKFVIKTYSSDPGWMADYVKWREDGGKYRAFSNKKIRENPQSFIDTGYPEYDAMKMYRPETREKKPHAL